MVRRKRRVISITYPKIRVLIKFRKNLTRALAIIDTGFTGHIAIPREIFNGDLGMPDLYMTWRMADGSEVNTPMYHGLIEVVGLASIPALVTILGDEYVVGRGTIDHFKVTFDHGKRIIAEL